MAAHLRLYHSGGGAVVSSLVSFAQKTECLKINRVFLPVKLVYFFYNAGVTSLFPYMPVFMTDLGLTAFQTGIARGAEPLLHVVVGPMWGAICDRFSRHKTILITAIILPAILYFCTQFIPPVPTPWVPLNNSVTMTTLLSRKHPDVRWQQVDDHQDFSDTLDRNLSTTTSSVYSTSTPQTTAAGKTKTDSTLTFALMILLIGSGRFFLSPFTPILDSTVVRMTKEHQCDSRKAKNVCRFRVRLIFPHIRCCYRRICKTLSSVE
ncbi:major facilitator superfamily domain-containing protein 6-like protein A isoform X2 [Amphiura filiformis]|uniref:major facilitator superfamily domain-containing protein 6-like protein A isoform X2 n=1 Tax=Amphiura filiformis TaxID=82378 RepID=UPI003B21D676